jgi:hypothetical protein
MEPIQAPKSITVEGEEHLISKFSQNIQTLVAIHTDWRNELQSERLKVSKTEAAIRALDAELSQAVNAELNPPAEEAANDVPAVAQEGKPIPPPAAPTPIKSKTAAKAK